MINHKTDFEYEGISLAVSFSYDPPYRGHRAVGGLQTEPDENPLVYDMEISLQDQNGVDHDLMEISFLSEKVVRWVEEQCYEYARSYEE